MRITAWILTRISRSQREEAAVLHPIEVRVARLNDLAFVSQDQYLPDTIVQRKIGEGEVFVATVNSELVGYMRLEHLWSVIPYIALIRVLPVYRRQGIGKALLGFVSVALQQRGHTVLYSSSQVDEPEPQAWHRHMGFEECGMIAGINNGVGEVFYRKRV